jgi:hypothetical protein
VEAPLDDDESRDENNSFVSNSSDSSDNGTDNGSDSSSDQASHKLDARKEDRDYKTKNETAEQEMEYQDDKDLAASAVVENYHVEGVAGSLSMEDKGEEVEVDGAGKAAASLLIFSSSEGPTVVKCCAGKDNPKMCAVDVPLKVQDAVLCQACSGQCHPGCRDHKQICNRCSLTVASAPSPQSTDNTERSSNLPGSIEYKATTSQPRKRRERPQVDVKKKRERRGEDSPSTIATDDVSNQTTMVSREIKFGGKKTTTSVPTPITSPSVAYGSNEEAFSAVLEKGPIAFCVGLARGRGMQNKAETHFVGVCQCPYCVETGIGAAKIFTLKKSIFREFKYEEDKPLKAKSKQHVSIDANGFLDFHKALPSCPAARGQRSRLREHLKKTNQPDYALPLSALIIKDGAPVPEHAGVTAAVVSPDITAAMTAAAAPVDYSSRRKLILENIKDLNKQAETSEPGVAEIFKTSLDLEIQMLKKINEEEKKHHEQGTTGR